jgi:hypothetical protein
VLASGAVTAVSLTVCSPRIPPEPAAPRPEPALIRLGAERAKLPYRDRWSHEKRVLLAQINRDRAAAGLAPLGYEPRGALVGDLFCLDMAMSRSVGHFDTGGRPPYLRWALAGGVDYHAQNTVAISGTSGRLGEPVGELLLRAHRSMMAERPPRDGHRRLILDPTMTHVGIGLARVGGQFRMSQEFARRLMEWVDLPPRPLAPGSLAALGGRPWPDWRIAEVEIRWEPFSAGVPRSGRDRLSYAYPEPIRLLKGSAPVGMADPSGAEPDFEVEPDGRFTVSFPLDAGPGRYFVVCLLESLPLREERRLVPATAALVTAE